MIPFFVLVISFGVCRAMGYIGWTFFDGWHPSLQGAVAIMLFLTASAHWGKRREDLIRMVPSRFPNPGMIVTLTGLLEIVGALGLLYSATSQAASIGLAVLLVAMFPANVKAAREGLTIGGRPVPSLPARTLLQLVFIGAVLLAG
ncbi:DoxX family protein [Marinicrinis sediminis]|uniref:DoxX family protein n=1 Tax=Marinicrinis sediminis TaxID=1652465 RepID=A0ABW5RG51_9BACL